uniref:E3 ubiquitin/ISG15 ligase TRIM25-like n=1 Tax=Chrysemys picta bellii TaxID=8478 RepID=A0A8C3J147_CHRPI
MSNTNFFFLEDNIVCPICLEVFTDPVTTACGHNFCMDCLQDYWDHQAVIGECPYCPQCREPFSSRPRLRKNISLGEIAEKFTREEAQATAKRPLAGPNDIPCDLCSSRKVKSIKSCLQCMASLCENHTQLHYEDKTFRNHQLLEPMGDLKARLCQKHHKLQELFCRTEGGLVCYTCIREEHKNHDAIPLQEERARKVVSMDCVCVLPTQKVVKNSRDEVNQSFAEIIKEIKRMQVKVLEFLDKEERAALVQLGNSIQQKQGKLADLNKQNLWLTDLLDNASDQQFLQVEFTPPPCDHSKLPPPCSLPFWSGNGTRLSRTQFDASLPTPIRSGFTLAISPFASCETDYCNLNFDPNTASEELLLFKETHSVLNMGILMESFFGSCQGFNHWPQVLCTRSLCEGCHYWEVEVSDSWVCLGATYSYMHKTGKSCIFYLIGRNNTSWCLEWDSLKFSVWHNNIQTVVKGSYYKTIGVFLDYAAGSLTFYGVTNTMNLIYRFLTTFTEPLYPAVMVSSGEGAVRLEEEPRGAWPEEKPRGGCLFYVCSPFS